MKAAIPQAFDKSLLLEMLSLGTQFIQLREWVTVVSVMESVLGIT
jgi:hypothetical protein